MVQTGYDAIDEGLQGLGLTEAPAVEVDLLVLAHLQMTEKMDINTYGYGYGGYRGYGYYG